MAWIEQYIKNTSPEQAAADNTKHSIRDIIDCVKTELYNLNELSKAAVSVGWSEMVERCLNDSVLLVKWYSIFNKNLKNNKKVNFEGGF